MGEVRITDYYVSGDVSPSGDGDGDDERVMEWEEGLPNLEDLYPLSQSLISAEMLSAFSITPEPYRNMSDVNLASQNTLSNLRGQLETTDLDPAGSEMRKLRRVDSNGDGDGDGGGAVEEIDGDGDGDDMLAKTSKRPRLVWTPKLHKRFVDVVAHLGVKNAVPKTIMQMMNVEGLSRENVASHLQKYRLYLKRMQVGSNHGNSSNDRLFASASVPNPQGAIPMQYHSPQMVHMPPQMVPNAVTGGGGSGYHGFDSNSYPYNMSMQQRDWSGNNFGYQQRMTPNEK